MPKFADVPCCLTSAPQSKNPQKSW